MTSIDWGIVAALLLLLLVGAAATRRHVNSVSAFLAAERCGGRYMIAVADNMARLGVVTLVWYFELNYERGFTSIWWTLMEEPALIVMALSGWVIYRFRQTRAMTLAEFFERRYSRRFRVFAGLVAFLAGIINFGVFPSVGARFFMTLWRLPETFSVFGYEASTFAGVTFVLLFLSMALIFVGGQLAVMVTDFLQGIVTNAAFIVLILFLLLTFDWRHVGEVLMAAPTGHSMVDPFDMGGEESFDFWYFVISVITLFYAAYGWQGTQGYNCSAINAHEAQMAYILGQWRFRVLMLITVVLPICIRTFLTHDDYSHEAAAVHDEIAAAGTAAMQNQLRTPLAMRAVFPAGMIGLATVAMLGAFISTHDTHMHSWGAIFVQDVVLPFRRKPLTPQRHLRMLRFSVLAVGVFVFAFSLVFQHMQYIAMFCALSAAVFIGGAGACLIGGLYWNRGTTAAAWSAMITGMALALLGIVIKQTPPDWLMEWRGEGAAAPFASVALHLQKKLTGQEMNFCAIASSVIAYVGVSLFGPKRKTEMDSLLHRGEYAVHGESSESIRAARTFWEKLGMSREFTGRDRLVTGITLAWPLVWSVIFFAVTLYALIVGISGATWLAYWRVWTWFILGAGTIVTIWFTVGGLLDMRKLFRMLHARAPDAEDDGRVRQE